MALRRNYRQFPLAVIHANAPVQQIVSKVTNDPWRVLNQTPFPVIRKRSPQWFQFTTYKSILILFENHLHKAVHPARVLPLTPEEVIVAIQRRNNLGTLTKMDQRHQSHQNPTLNHNLTICSVRRFRTNWKNRPEAASSWPWVACTENVAPVQQRSKLWSSLCCTVFSTREIAQPITHMVKTTFQVYALKAMGSSFQVQCRAGIGRKKNNCESEV